jgi:hypothetical protein
MEQFTTLKTNGLDSLHPLLITLLSISVLMENTITNGLVSLPVHMDTLEISSKKNVSKMDIC